MNSKLTGEGAAADDDDDDDVKKNIGIFRDENKSCSACREWVNERLKDTPGSQLLSDIQTFLAGNQLYDI